LIIWAPMFSVGSFSCTSLATVTPSLVMVGLPYFLSITTFRPLGPSVAFTASARMFTPRKSAARAAWSNISCFAICRSSLCPQSVARLIRQRRGAWESLGEDPEDVLFLHDEQLLAVDLHLAAGILAEEDAVPRLHDERERLPLLGHPARPGGDDFALLRLLLGAVRNNDAAVLLVLLLEALDEDPVVERTQLGLELGCRRHGARLSFLRLEDGIEDYGPTGPQVNVGRLVLNTNECQCTEHGNQGQERTREGACPCEHASQTGARPRCPRPPTRGVSPDYCS